MTGTSTNRGPPRCDRKAGSPFVFIALGGVCLNLKMERVWQRDDANHAEAMSDIADHIISFCNSVRLHASLGNLPPNAFEQKSAINQPIDVSRIT